MPVAYIEIFRFQFADQTQRFENGVDRQWRGVGKERVVCALGVGFAGDVPEQAGEAADAVEFALKGMRIATDEPHVEQNVHKGGENAPAAACTGAAGRLDATAKRPWSPGT